MAKNLQLLPGKSFPLGATVYPDGVNFCLYSQNAEAIELLLFDTSNASQPVQIIKLDPLLNKTCYYCRQEEFLEVSYASLEPHLIWHGQYLGEPDWSEDSHYLAFSLFHPNSGEHIHVILNAYWKALKFELPPLKSGYWHRIIDTALAAPDDFSDLKAAVKIHEDNYLVTARSSLVLMESRNFIYE